MHAGDGRIDLEKTVEVVWEVLLRNARSGVVDYDLHVLPIYPDADAYVASSKGELKSIRKAG